MSETFAHVRHRISTTKPGIVAFDFFDTLVLRHTAPENVKKLASDKLVRWFALPLSWADVYAMRASCERDLAAKNLQAYGEDEFYFADLPGELHTRLVKRLRDDGRAGSFSSMPPECFAEYLYAFESAAEKGVLHPAPGAAELLRYAADLADVVIISDFYLGAPFLAELMRHSGLDVDSVKHIYVSCDLRASKRSGRLYGKVLERAGVSPDAVLMIGDNPLSDAKNAAAAGCGVVLLDHGKSAFYERQAKTFGSTRAAAAELDAILAEDYGEEDVCKEVAFVLYVFIAILHARLRENNVSDAVFLAREGYILQKLFDMYQNAQFASAPICAITSHYFMASRRSLYLPSCDVLQKETFSLLADEYPDISAEYFLRSLGFDASGIARLAGKLPFDCGERVPDFFRSDRFRITVADEEFRAMYEAQRVSQREAVRDYADSFALRKDTALMLVDVGWKASMQKMLQKILGPEREMTGWYIGLRHIPDRSQASERQPGIRGEGVLFSDMHDRRLYNPFVESPSLLEVMLPAPHGCTLRYTRDESGTVRPLLEDNPDEMENINALVMPTLGCVLKRFQRINELFRRQPVRQETLRTLAAHRYARLMYLPDEKSGHFFLRLKHWDNFGIHAVTIFKNNAYDVTICESKKTESRLAYSARFLRRPRFWLRRLLWPAAELRAYALYPLGHIYGLARYALYMFRTQFRRR